MGRGRSTALVLAALGAGALGGAAGAESMTAVYAFSWAGLDVGRLEVRFEADGGDYQARWQAETTGLVGALFPFTSQGAVKGRREGESYLPSSYGGHSRWRDGGREWRVAFAPDGIEVPADDLAEREPVPIELRVAPDPVSLALVAIARAAPGARLGGQSFDGRRALRAELACDDAGQAGPTTELAARSPAASWPAPRAVGGTVTRATPSASRGAFGCVPVCRARVSGQ
jgi:Protein of unknown function (DUF3108)